MSSAAVVIGTLTLNSIFISIAEKEYLVHFTSTTPFHMRYTLLNTDTEAIKLTVWYSRPNRLDVYVDGNYIMATNARINHLGFYVLEMPIGLYSTVHL